MNSPTPFEHLERLDMVALISGAGTGSKLLQSYLDGHPQVISIPAYPLVYFYPHWDRWQDELGRAPAYEDIRQRFLEKHGSVIDSCRIPGLGGMTSLGPNRDESVSVDEEIFVTRLDGLMEGRAVTPRNFLLAVHGAFCLASGDVLSKKTTILYHIHNPHYLPNHLLSDFPDAKILTMTRDYRGTWENRLHANFKVDDAKLDETDARIWRHRACLGFTEVATEHLGLLHAVPGAQIRAVRHEDLGDRRHQILGGVRRFLNICDDAVLGESTFGGKPWWTSGIYRSDVKTTGLNPSVLSEDWRRTIGTVANFVIEGVFFDYNATYGYAPSLYTEDGSLQRAFLRVACFLPWRMDWKWWVGSFLWPSAHIRFLVAAMREGSRAIPLSDYTWNGTYLFKWSYQSLELWRPRILRTLVANGPHRRPMAKKLICGLYVAGRYLEFLTAMSSFPSVIIKRGWMFNTYISRRNKGKTIVPEPFGNHGVDTRSIEVDSVYSLN